MIKKLSALFLALALLLGACAFASAEDARPTLLLGVPDNPLIEDWNTNLQTLRVEEVMNVNLEFTLLPFDKTEMVQKIEMMMLAGGQDLPDVIVGSDLGGLTNLETYGKMGMILPLNQYFGNTPYLDENLASLTVVPISKADYKKYITCTDGNIYGLAYRFMTINNSLSGARIMLFQPWLDALGLEVPQTTEEFADMLRAFRDDDPNGNGIADEIPLMGYKDTVNNNLLRQLMDPFIYTQEHYFLDNEGTVEFVAIDERWKEGLKYIKSLFDEGLISTLTLTQDSSQFTAILAAEPHTIGAIARVSPSNLPSGDPRREQFVIMGALEGPDGTRQATQVVGIPSVAWVVTKNCENPELAFAVGDYLSGTEMNVWSRYGREGFEWEYLSEPGESMYSSLGFVGDVKELSKVWGSTQNIWWQQIGPVVGDGNKITYRSVLVKSEGAYNHSIPIGQTITRELDWANTTNQVYGLVFTNEEQKVVTEFQATIENYVAESFAAFITGEKDIDSEWASYVEQFYKMGLETYMNTIQECWDRMNG